MRFRCLPNGTELCEGDGVTHLIEVIATGIEAKPIVSQFTLSPNPNDGHFQIDVPTTLFKKNGEVHLSLTNIIGQQIWAQPLVEGKNLIFLKNKLPGIYLVTLQQGKNTWVQKIVGTIRKPCIFLHLKREHLLLLQMLPFYTCLTNPITHPQLLQILDDTSPKLLVDTYD